MGVLEVGITALNAFRSQLTTTSHNVANVNTEGYTRQVVQLGTLPPNFTGVGYIGNGVQVEDVTRQFDQFLADRVRAYTASSEESQIYLERASRIDNILADPDAGLSVAMQNFFNSVQDVADDPTSITTRDVMLSSANILTDRFHSIFNFMESMRSEVNQDLKTVVGEVNKLAESIAEVNAAIQATSGKGSPNDLLDKRDQLIKELSEMVSVTTVAEDSGAMNIYIGNGQGLVVGTTTFPLSTQINDNEPDRVEIVLDTGSKPYVITNSLQGGKLGGYLRFRQEVLDPAENALGRLATGLAYAFNDQHQLGTDLNGNLGNEFFNIPRPPDTDDAYVQQMVVPLDATGNVTITGIVPAELQTSDYEITKKSGAWQIVRRDTQELVTLQEKPVGTLNFDGITLDVSAASENDKFVIRPTRLTSRAFEVSLNDARQIAIATAISVSQGDQTASPATLNDGTSQITDVGLISRIDPPVFPGDITITFADDDIDADPDPDPRFVVGDNTISQIRLSSSTAYADAADYDPTTDSGKTYVLEIDGYGELEFTIKGTPVAGDTFTFSLNTTGVGNNGNGLKLAGLQTAKTMRNNEAANPQPTSSFTDLYSSMIGNVGAQTRQAIISNETQSRLLEQATASYDEVSGVNLDEEAANLVHFQQAYQAATQVIRVSNQLFDSLLNSVG